MLVDVTSMMASVDSPNRGSGTVSTSIARPSHWCGQADTSARHSWTSIEYPGTWRGNGDVSAALHAGAVDGGNSQLFQQLIFRPIPGSAEAETPIRDVYLGSADATPGGGVHGVWRRNAAKTALAGDGARGLTASTIESRAPVAGPLVA
jgi:hypothetical protein